MFDLNRGLEPLLKTVNFPYGVWDVEAANWWDLQMIGVFDGKDYYHFRNVPDFIDHIISDKYRSFRWFAHFGGRYDLNFVFDWLRSREDIDVSFYCSGAMVVQMTLRRKGVTVKLCDSYRLLQAGLRGLGIAFDVKHKKTEIDFTTIEYNRQLIEYNEQDCKCLYEVLERFFEETGVMSETFATQALRVWRKDFLKETIWKPRQEVLDFARTSYHGGRVEVFKRTSEHLHAYDVNSMYPYVMQFPMPVEYLGESHKLVDLHYGFVDATVTVPEDYVPTLPVRLEKLFFPCGVIRSVWTSEELIAAEARGARIQKIHTAHYFKTREIFKSYIDKLYAIKQNATEPARTIAKLLMNALYGKFGQNPRKKVYCLERIAPDGSFPILLPDGVPSGFAYYERDSRSAYLLPHLAAAVTSKARLHLLSRLDGSSYYCDTDSVFTSVPFPTTSKQLGEWSEVGEGECTFIQPKLYRFNGKWKAKGLNQHHDNCRNRDTCDCGSVLIDDFVDGGINKVLRSRSIKEALRTGERATAHITVQKQLRESRPKRAWMSDNQNTRPWDIGELT